MEILAGVGGLVMSLGGLMAFIGWVWLIIIGFKKGGALWGILIFFFNWLAGLIFCIMNKTGWLPLVLMVIGWIICVVGGAVMFVGMGGMKSLR